MGPPCPASRASSTRCRRRTPVRRVALASLSLDLLQLLHQRLDAARHLAALRLPLALLLAQRLDLGVQLGRILSAQLVLQGAHLLAQLVALLLEAIALAAQVLNGAGGLL